MILAKKRNEILWMIKPGEQFSSLEVKEKRATKDPPTIESRHLVESPLSGTKILTQLYTGSYVDQNSHKISFQMDLQRTHKKRTKELKRL